MVKFKFRFIFRVRLSFSERVEIKRRVKGRVRAYVSISSRPTSRSRSGQTSMSESGRI